MIEINDEMLLRKIIELCDGIKNQSLIEKFHEKNKDLKLVYPLDDDIKTILVNIKQNGLDKGSDELSYEINYEIDELWNILIEKSIICLRIFDKREPFMVNGKHQYVKGLDKLKDYYKNYTDFEGVLYGSDAYYRDHVFHVIRVWLLGVYLLLSTNNQIVPDKKRLIDLIHFEGEMTEKVEKAEEDDIKKILKDLKDGDSTVIKKNDKYFKIQKKMNDSGVEEYILLSANTFNDEVNILEKISMWTIMALCHDLGYPLEKSKKILFKTEKMMEAFISNPYVERNLKFDGTQDSNNLDIILFISKKMKPVLENNEKFVAKYTASIQDKYKCKYKLSLEDFSHGIISAIIIYKMLIYFIESDNNPDPNYVFDNEDARQFYLRRDILRAIASHTCDNIYHIDVSTFPMLLFVCDELQEWGRKTWKNMYRGIPNSAVKLSILSFNTKIIEYDEEIDMKNAVDNQLFDNIERIIKKQYILYLTTFRDGQYTARREFDFKKHIHIKVSEEYKSIESIDIDFSINHGSTNNCFDFTIKSSGDEDDKENITKVKKFTEDIIGLINLYNESKLYGVFKFIDDREVEQ